MARLLPKQPLVTGLAAVIEAATTTYIEALNDEKQPRQRTSTWQQTVEGHNGTHRHEPDNTAAPNAAFTVV